MGNLYRWRIYTTDRDTITVVARDVKTAEIAAAWVFLERYNMDDYPDPPEKSLTIRDALLLMNQSIWKIERDQVIDGIQGLPHGTDSLT